MTRVTFMLHMLIITRSKSQSYARKVRFPRRFSTNDSFTSWTWTLAVFAATHINWLARSL